MPVTNAPIAVVFGTRPEAIKLAPVVLALRRAGQPHVVVTTGQHREMVTDVLGVFGIVPDADLGLMREGQTLDYLLGNALERIGEALDTFKPRAVVVQGDTTSMLGATLAAFHRHIPVAHVEAGLRSHDLSLPFPEEMNRRAAAVMVRWHFAPTMTAAENLRAEGVNGEIDVVGNTVVDAVNWISDHERPRESRALEFVGESPYVLATAHRRESWDGGIARIATALRDVLRERRDHRLLFVVHPNPAARAPVDTFLGGNDRAMIVDALPYPDFIHFLRGARLAVSDSGGVQEEGPTLGVPVLVTRTVTERSEGVAAGAVRVIGTDEQVVKRAVLELLDDADSLRTMAAAGTGLYGDGRSALRIVERLTGG
ncbi:MAG: UDP-N-acetylglucosamine 2-epimerase (non-hydrolyzing) [Chloroflexota bacterium]|nr:UDP-N-acetylglucosamine 2-epimerase (non-hydrolyzing) [Chloroflexota bacterium]